MEPLRILTPEGELVGDPPVDLAGTRRLLAAMITARTYDHKASAMQRQGRLATYPPFEGQEAAQIGSAAAVRRDDWMVATYRDAAAMWFHGYPWLNLVLTRIGDERGGAPPEGVRCLPASITVGAHMLHAVGLGWAARLRGEEAVAITYFGDGATSEGDFHEAMNFAGVYRTPTVFVCENNHYAISMPRSRQTAAETIAAKATGYGMPGEYVDGNDLFAVYAATARAVERARAGEGPTLIEALTYRSGPHTTTDDALRYRPQEEVDLWRSRDPIDRVRRYLRAAGEWDEAWERGVAEDAAAEIESAIQEAETLEPLGPVELFAGMFAEPTAPLADQLLRLRRERGEA